MSKFICNRADGEACSPCRFRRPHSYEATTITCYMPVPIPIEASPPIPPANEPPKHDIVKNQAHYTEGRKYEPANVIADWGSTWAIGNAIKYLSRAGRKDDAVQDLKKAIWYIEFEIKRINGEV